MDGMINSLRTEVRGLDVRLDENTLVLACSGGDIALTAPVSAENAERLRLEMAKAQLWEWNQFEELRARAELRYRRYLGSWLMMCLAAFGAYLGYPDFYICIFFALVSVFLWWRAGHLEQEAEQEAQGERNRFRPEWEYIQQRLEESDSG